MGDFTENLIGNRMRAMLQIARDARGQVHLTISPDADPIELLPILANIQMQLLIRVAREQNMVEVVRPINGG
jgi:hypothetical protein